MAWYISQALMTAYENSLCSPGPEVESSVECCSDGKQFALLKSNPTPQAYLSKDRMTAFSRLSRFGMTFAPLTGNRGEELLTWFLAGFPAKTSAQQGKERESPEKEADSGKNSPASLAKYDRDSHSWRTHQYSLAGDLTLFSETWPRWGIMQDMALYPQQTRALRISGKGSGYSGIGRWQTFAPGTHGRGWSPHRGVVNALLSGAKPLVQTLTVDEVYAEECRKAGCATLDEYKQKAKMWPTPCTRDWKGANAEDGLTRQDGKSRMDQLPNAVNFSTPQSRDFRTGQTERYENPDRTKNLNDQIGGQLNPDWVEILMGWPKFWTSLTLGAVIGNQEHRESEPESQQELTD